MAETVEVVVGGEDAGRRRRLSCDSHAGRERADDRPRRHRRSTDGPPRTWAPPACVPAAADEKIGSFAATLPSCTAPRLLHVRAGMHPFRPFRPLNPFRALLCFRFRFRFRPRARVSLSPLNIAHAAGRRLPSCARFRFRFRPGVATQFFLAPPRRGQPRLRLRCMDDACPRRPPCACVAGIHPSTPPSAPHTPPLLVPCLPRAHASALRRSDDGRAHHHDSR